ncbi:MAG TPA: hypothetical protein DG048_14025 [Pseudoalteromonas sp.]|nr:hypothetical protein [Pseudoalteromonas sp.]|tara:strand:+ start:1783 stop:2007 length:225 start_codon:yes stop_codon:yes gene_type:complete
MEDNTLMVLRGFLELSDSEKKKVTKLLEEYNDYPALTTKKIKETVNEFWTKSQALAKSEINLGPLNQGCPCCGK